MDIIGCEVVADSGECLGQIADVLSAHTDIYVLKNEKKEGMFPAADGVISDVDTVNKKLTVNKKRFFEVFAEQ